MSTTLRSGLRRRWPWFMAAGFVAAVGLAMVWMARFSASPTLVVTSIEPITRDGLPKSKAKNDGTRIYFNEAIDGHNSLSQVSVTGGEISRIGGQLSHTLVRDVAPDGSKLLVSDFAWNGTPQTFWIVPLPSGSPHRLGALEGHAAAWSSDGKQLVFAKSSELWAADSNGAQPRKLLALSGVPLQVQFSPDGERIRYTLESNSRAALWQSRADGSDAHALLPGWHSGLGHSGGIWSRDGKYYAFLESSRTFSNVWVMPQTRSGWIRRPAAPVQLTHGPLFFFDLSFNRDGRTLFAVGAMARGELVRYDPKTRQVSRYLSGISAADLAFSRDGQWIAYVTYPDETLWRCRIDGSDRQQLTTSGSAVLPQWSPDGKRIAYMAEDWGKPVKIAIISAEGGSPEEVAQDDWAQGDANWSPDGTQMIFHTFSDSLARGEIRQVDLRNHEVTAIPASKGLYSPRWSPDGRYLAALSADTQRLMLFDFTKGLWSTWINTQDVNTRSLGFPVWSTDSRFLYFDATPDRAVNDVSEWRARPGERVAEKMVYLRDEPRYWGPYTTWSTVGPDGGLYFTRERSTSEIYALHLSEK